GQTAGHPRRRVCGVPRNQSGLFRAWTRRRRRHGRGNRHTFPVVPAGGLTKRGSDIFESSSLVTTPYHFQGWRGLTIFVGRTASSAADRRIRLKNCEHRGADEAVPPILADKNSEKRSCWFTGGF